MTEICNILRKGLVFYFRHQNMNTYGLADVKIQALLTSVKIAGKWSYYFPGCLTTKTAVVSWTEELVDPAAGLNIAGN
jgi:hypothetical protein